MFSNWWNVKQQWRSLQKPSVEQMQLMNFAQTTSFQANEYLALCIIKCIFVIIMNIRYLFESLNTIKLLFLLVEDTNHNGNRFIMYIHNQIDVQKYDHYDSMKAYQKSSPSPVIYIGTGINPFFL